MHPITIQDLTDDLRAVQAGIEALQARELPPGLLALGLEGLGARVGTALDRTARLTPAGT